MPKYALIALSLLDSISWIAPPDLPTSHLKSNFLKITHKIPSNRNSNFSLSLSAHIVLEIFPTSQATRSSVHCHYDLSLLAHFSAPALRWATEFLCAIVRQSASVSRRQELARHLQAQQLAATPLRLSEHAQILLNELSENANIGRRKAVDRLFTKSGMVTSAPNSRVCLLLCYFQPVDCTFMACPEFFTESVFNGIVSVSTCQTNQQMSPFERAM